MKLTSPRKLYKRLSQILSFCCFSLILSQSGTLAMFSVRGEWVEREFASAPTYAFKPMSRTERGFRSSTSYPTPTSNSSDLLWYSSNNTGGECSNNCVNG